MDLNQNAFESTLSGGSNALSMTSLRQFFLILRFAKLETLFWRRDSLGDVRTFWRCEIINTLTFSICIIFSKFNHAFTVLCLRGDCSMLDRFSDGLQWRFETSLEVYLPKNCKRRLEGLQLSTGTFSIDWRLNKDHLSLNSSNGESFDPMAWERENQEESHQLFYPSISVQNRGRALFQISTMRVRLVVDAIFHDCRQKRIIFNQREKSRRTTGDLINDAYNSWEDIPQ